MMKYKKLYNIDHVRFYEGEKGLAIICFDGKKTLGVRLDNDNEAFIFQMRAMLKDMKEAGFKLTDEEEPEEEDKKLYE